MAQPQPFGFGNDDLADLNNLSGEESEDENREDEIKQLLAEVFSNETFDDGSEHSFTLSEHSKMRDRTSNESSLHSVMSINGNGNSEHFVMRNENSGFSFGNNEHATVLPNINEQDVLRRANLLTNGKNLAEASTATAAVQTLQPQPIPAHEMQTMQIDNGGGGGDKNGGHNGIDESNSTVSMIHKTHCPQLTNGGKGDTNGNDENWTSTPINKMEQLQTMNSYRERQIARSEETIAALTKDKRALNHQIGLMRTEMIQMQGSYVDLEKALKLKEEEVEFLKSKIEEAIVDYESLKRAEKDLKDENNRHLAQIGRLEQEVKLLSTIGTSTQQAEVDTIVRQIRDRHAQEIIAFKTEVANLEAELRSYKRHSHYGEQKETESRSSQTLEVEAEMTNHEQPNLPQRTNCTQTYLVGDEIEALMKPKALQLSSSTQTIVIEQVTTATQIQATQLTSTSTQTNALQSRQYEKVIPEEFPQKTEVAATQTLPQMCLQEASTQTVSICAQSATQTVPEPERGENTSQTVSAIAEVQTDETLQTYEVLNSLFEKWATEVSDATKRAELAESQVQFTEVSLRKLRKKFKSLYNMTSVCRREWKKQEEFLKNRNEEMKSRYLAMLVNLHQKLDGVDVNIEA